MRSLLSFLLLAAFALASFTPVKKPVPVSPLSEYSAAWNDAKYLKGNTAAKAAYMTATEKEVIYILNLARMNPVLFANTVIRQYPDKKHKSNTRNSEYYRSLLKTMSSMKALRLLYPDSLCFFGAQCHAIYSGEIGYVGHERVTEECKKKWYYNGECCDYGHDDPLEIVMALLIDEDVPSLGHRDICLSPYKVIGVSIQPHKIYSYTAVLDFHF